MKGALFDLDGVLIDSEGQYTRFWSEIDRRYPTGIEKFAIKIKGTTLDKIFEHFPDPSLQRKIVRMLDEFQHNMPFEMYPDAEEFLTLLQSRGISMAIVTSSDERKMNVLFDRLPQLRPYFSAIVHAGMITHSKPHPEPYLKGAEALGLPPEDCCVFEDSLQGLAAGRASGAKVIAMATTYTADRLQGLADVIVRSFKEIDISRL